MIAVAGTSGLRTLFNRTEPYHDAAAAAANACGRQNQVDANAMIMTCAASAPSAGLASSRGVWLSPSTHGTKIIALGTRWATSIVSCAAPETILTGS